MQGRTEGDRNKPLVHSVKFLEAKAELQRRRAERKMDVEMVDGPTTDSIPRNPRVQSNQAPSTEALVPGLVTAVKGWAERLSETTKAEYRQAYGENWQEAYNNDMVRQHERKRKWTEESEKKAEQMQHFAKREATSVNFKGRTLWSGRYEDDYDPRYGF